MRTNIPYKVTFFLANKKVNNGRRVVFLSVCAADTLKLNKERRKKLAQRIKRQSGLNYSLFKDKLEDHEIFEVTLENTGFKLRLLDNFFGYNTVCVELLHPELEKYSELYGYRFSMILPSYNFTNILYNAGSIINRELVGSFCIDATNFTTSSFETQFVLELIEDEGLKTEKEVSKALFEKPKTIKWIPGHKYLLENRTEILYLGTVKDLLVTDALQSRSIRNYVGARFYETVLHTCNHSVRFPTLYLFINYSLLDDETSLIIDEAINSGLDIKNAVQFIYNRIDIDSLFILRVLTERKPAVDLGSVFKCSTIEVDLTEVVSTYAIQQIKAVSTCINTERFLSSLTKESANVVRSQILDCFVCYIISRFQNNRTVIITGGKRVDMLELNDEQLLKLTSSNCIDRLKKLDLLDLTDKDYIDLIRQSLK